MCTGQIEKADVAGTGKGVEGWFPLRSAQVYYDHPLHAQMEEAVMIDFLNAERGPGARVAVELSPESARELARMILDSLDAAHHDHSVEVASVVAATH